MANRIQLDSAGIRAVLGSPETRAAVREVAEGIASRASARTDLEVVVVNAGSSRARSYVRLQGRNAAQVEADERILGGSV